MTRSRTTSEPPPGDYDPFVRGRHPVGVMTRELVDGIRDRRFPCEIWYPAAAEHAGQDLDPATQDVFRTPPTDETRRQAAVRDADPEPGAHPLILFSHNSGGDRRQSTFVCTHLGSHGYVVAAVDHSERVDPRLAPKDAEAEEEKAARTRAWIEGRVPDVRFLLDRLAASTAAPPLGIDVSRIGIVGHSFGGWTALAAIDVEPRIGAVVALAPAGASRRKPGIIPVELSFDWGRDVPTLYLVAENDACLPLAGMHELFDRTPATKRMAILGRADHLHFVDEIAAVHEAVRTMPWSGEFARIQAAMLPFAELCPQAEAHAFVRALTLCHLDAWLRDRDDAGNYWDRGLRADLQRRGIEAVVPAESG